MEVNIESSSLSEVLPNIEENLSTQHQSGVTACCRSLRAIPKYRRDLPTINDLIAGCVYLCPSFVPEFILHVFNLAS